MRFVSLIAGLILLCVHVKGQTSPQLSSSEIKEGLEKLGVTGKVLYIAAHPDDENTRLLAYLVHERKVRTGYLSLTRGDGGQNLIGSEQSEQLGLIRTQELLAARRIDGAEQFFTRANDFGFSKTSQETFKLWDKERILGDVVWVIRKFRPDIIITRFPRDARAGHGQHAASSILAQEAFRAAADPQRFREQLKLVKPWQAKSIFWNTYNFGSLNTTSEDQLKINVGTYNALLGKGYGEIAAESRSQHKSQGFGVASQRGESYEYFTLLDGSPVKKDILEQVNTGWGGLSNGNQVQTLIEKINREYKVEKPVSSVPDLLKLYSLIEKTDNQHLKEQKLKEVADLLLSAAGIWFEAYSQAPRYAIGEDVNIKVQAISRTELHPLLQISHETKTLLPKTELTENQLQSFELTVPAEKLTQPYWLEEKHSPAEYVVKEQSLIGYPENPDPLSLDFSLIIQGKEIRYKRPVVYKFTDPIRAEVYRNLEVAPPVVANLQSSQLLFTGDSPQSLQIKLKSLKDAASGEISLSLPPSWKAIPSKITFNLKNKEDEQNVTFSIFPAADATSGKVVAQIKTEGRLYSKSIHTIQYNHIPTITWFPEAEASLVKLYLKTAGKNIGYIPGAGDLIPEALRQIGYQVSILTEKDIIDKDLNGFDAIITGVRLYNIEPRIKFMSQKLLKYVAEGGILLVQYNVNQPLKIDQIGPYPFSITRNRVTEEDARINILNPADRIFNYPNKISSKDFENWVQERGIYYADDTSNKYRQPLSMKDTGEEEQKGALLIADYGKGRFIYTGLAFFRQLPAGVPGAYRLFVNLISK